MSTRTITLTTFGKPAVTIVVADLRVTSVTFAEDVVDDADARERLLAAGVVALAHQLAPAGNLSQDVNLTSLLEIEIGAAAS